ncbi:MAG: hypothetical protein WBE66_03900 [Mycobacterium sp.]
MAFNLTQTLINSHLVSGNMQPERPGEQGCRTCVAHRIDGAYGGRNLVCSCPPVEAFA